MSAPATISPEEYLHTSFEGADREYLNGEVVERGLGNRKHSEVQWRLCCYFGEVNRRHRVVGQPELRVRVAEDRYRVIDLAVYQGESPEALVPSTPPLVAIEILSPDDRMSDMLQKLSEYQRWGVKHVFVIDPEVQTLFAFSEAGLQQVEALSVPELESEIPPAELF